MKISLALQFLISEAQLENGEREHSDHLQKTKLTMKTTMKVKERNYLIDLLQ